jgi:putative membrane protein
MRIRIFPLGILTRISNGDNHSGCRCLFSQADEEENLWSRIEHRSSARIASKEDEKMKTIVSAVCCVALGCVLVFAQGSAPAMTDQQFVDFAAQTDMLEANLGQLAATQASSQGVKDYAQMLVTDHTDDYTQLGIVASKDNLVVPKGLDGAHDKMIAPFKNLKGPAFDRRYIQEMIAGHTKAIQVYTKEATDAQSADLKAYANQTLPTLQKHLDGAKNLAKAKPSSKSM